MNISFVRDDVVRIYQDCNDVDTLKRILLDMRNEIIRLRLIVESLESERENT